MSTEKKLTAVEWLENQIRYYISNDDRLFEIFRLAKELEKQQIIDAYKNGYICRSNEDMIGGSGNEENEYYEKTFKN